jgi:hypothetical protein
LARLLQSIFPKEEVRLEYRSSDLIYSGSKLEMRLDICIFTWKTRKLTYKIYLRGGWRSSIKESNTTMLITYMEIQKNNKLVTRRNEANVQNVELL